LEYLGEGLGYPQVAVVSFGDGNAVVLAPAYTQVTDPDRFRQVGLDPAGFDVFVVKSRVHFRRGFDETGFARTIVVVEAPGPFVGTTFLDALPYENVDLGGLYPYGTPPGR
jgi:microcystin degradation protein MlrC